MREARSAGELGEDLLKELAQRGETEAEWRPVGILPGAEAGRLEEAVAGLRKGGHAERSGDSWRLTKAGRKRAVELLRAHRLLETYLARESGRPAGELHGEADRAEHHLTPEKVDALADAMNRPRFDPHGDPIPERGHELHGVEQVALTEVPEGALVRVAHMEDEPEAEFRKLVEMGFAVELPLRVVGQEASKTVVELAGEWLELEPLLARQVEVLPWSEELPYPEELRRLSSLGKGESGQVAFISPACMGPERRRLLDFGFVPGSEVRCEFKSPFGSPVAYSVRGSTLGLRREQANNIFITKAS